MPFDFHESVSQQSYRAFMCTTEWNSLGEIFKDDSTLMWFLSKMLRKLQNNRKADHSLTSMLFKWTWVVFHCFSCLDETCAFLLQLKLCFNERKVRNGHKWRSFDQWKKATIILQTGRYLGCCCGGLPCKWTKCLRFFFFWRASISGGTSYELWGSSCCWIVLVKPGAEAAWGCMVFHSSASGWCIWSSGSLFFRTCCSSPRLDLALALSVNNTGAEGPGCSISRWSDAHGLRYSCLEGEEQVGDAGSANPRWLQMRWCLEDFKE